MEYLKIQSQGEIESRAFTLIGNSTKRGDASQIGMFGSGLKYAISSLLRNNIDFKVFSGTKELEFSLKTEGFRNNDFQIICLNGQETSFTSSMGGKDWDNPFAPIREIYSNALDEDPDAILDKAYSVHGNEDTTTFFIRMTNDVRDFYNNIDLYFCNKNKDVLFSNRAGSVYRAKRRGVRLFRKGILCYDNNSYAAQYNYNCPNFEINESRVLSNSSMASYHVGAMWKLCKDPELIEEFLKTMLIENTYSLRIDFGEPWLGALTNGFSKAWDEVIRRNKFASAESIFLFEAEQLADRILLPYSLIEHLKVQYHDIDVIGLKSNKNGHAYNVLEKSSQILQDKVTDAISVLMKTRYRSRLDSPVVKYCKFERDSTLALAENDTIYLSIKLESKSVSEIAKIIIEENEHNITSLGYQNSSFQDHLFDLYYDELESGAKLKRTVE